MISKYKLWLLYKMCCITVTVVVSQLSETLQHINSILSTSLNKETRCLQQGGNLDVSVSRCAYVLSWSLLELKA